MLVRNIELRDQTKKLVDTFINVMDNKFVESYGTMFERVTAIINGDAELIAKILELRPDIKEEYLSKCLMYLQQILKTLINADIFSLPPHASTKEEHGCEIAQFITKILEVRDNEKKFFGEGAIKRDYENSVFPKFYQLYENYLYDPSPHDYLVCPISNLTSLKGSIFDSWQIRKVLEAEANSLVEAHNRMGTPLGTWPELVIYLNYDEKWENYLRKIVSSLRLVKAEDIFVTNVYHGFHFPFKPMDIMEAPEGTCIGTMKYHPLSNIEPQEEEELKSLWEVLKDLKDSSYIMTALRRFNFAFERERKEDAWVDYFISLESLFQEDDVNIELGFRLRTRISKVLGGDTFESRKDMRTKIRDLYRIRSAIVHGAVLRTREMKRIEELREITAASIKWFINNDDREDHNKILNLLDLNGK